MRNKLFISAFIALCLFVTSCKETSTTNYTQYVDQYIGTGGHGHVFMGANVPFGAVQLGPTSIPQTWDWCSGYHISDTTVIGFAHMHLSGTGIGDLSDIAIMPVIGEVTLNRGRESDPNSGMWSYYSRVNEKVKPGYYATRLDRYGVDVELTATARVGFHKYTFPETDDARIVINLEDGNAWDGPVEGYIIQESDTKISGYRYSRGWANDQKVFFTAEFSQPITKFEVFEKEVSKEGFTVNPVEGNSLKARRTYGIAHFDTDPKKPIHLKVALSPVSIENAKENMVAELPDWNFKKVIADADKAWNKELSKIDFKTSDPAAMRNFYTAMYHTMIAPSLFCDVNGDYRGADGQMHKNDGFVNYTTFSLWDTYRAAHPLMSIIHPEKMSDMINTMLYIYKHQGKLPVWHLVGCETNCMVGNPGVAVVADAIMKDIGGFDLDLAYEALVNSSMLDERDLDLMKEYGYIPYDKQKEDAEGLSMAMEYAIADWGVAQVAKKLGKEEDYQYFLQRSKTYQYYFDPSVGFMRGKDSKGNFRPEFDPFRSVHRANDYVEGNAWQYTWLVPHDILGLVDIFGGLEPFTTKLDSLFIVTGDLGEHASPDISGLIGQYAHGNEPSHHVLYMYPYIGQEHKTAKLVRQVLNELYFDEPDGLSGNEDVGQMSAWYILSAMGFYQVEPAGGKYIFGSPIMDEAVINVGDGKTFTVRTHNNSKNNIYIQSVTLNGEAYDKNYIDFADIMKGGILEFTMGDTH